jgi:aspartyl aminopeptidase
MEDIQLAKQLIDFIYDSPTAFHAVDTVRNKLIPLGFQELKEQDEWQICKDGKYYITKNDSAIFAFTVGNGEIDDEGFKIIGSHTDSPTFKVKPSPNIISENKYIKLNTEVYGGPILNTWLDRPLSLAGKVTLKSDNVFYPEVKLVNINKPILIIPNLAIHMNRNINEGIELNKQKDMLPLLGLVNDNLEQDNYLLKILSKELNVSVSDILGFELYLYEFEKGCISGLNNEFISSGRLDNLAMVHASVEALCKCNNHKGINVMAAFDNEEIGSASKQGADSNVLSNILERICIGLKKDRQDFFRSLAKSFMISSDLAHAVHPNSPEKADPTNRPIINCGPVIKISSNIRYTTDSESEAVYEQICNLADVPVQKFVNRSDLRGGSTIGPISSTHLPIRSVDMGTPILAMHSVRELGGVKDHMYVTKSFEKFYSL